MPRLTPEQLRRKRESLYHRMGGTTSFTYPSGIFEHVYQSRNPRGASHLRSIYPSMDEDFNLALQYLPISQIENIFRELAQEAPSKTSLRRRYLWKEGNLKRKLQEAVAPYRNVEGAFDRLREVRPGQIRAVENLQRRPEMQGLSKDEIAARFLQDFDSRGSFRIKQIKEDLRERAAEARRDFSQFLTPEELEQRRQESERRAEAGERAEMGDEDVRSRRAREFYENPLPPRPQGRRMSEGDLGREEADEGARSVPGDIPAAPPAAAFQEEFGYDSDSSESDGYVPPSERRRAQSKRARSGAGAPPPGEPEDMPGYYSEEDEERKSESGENIPSGVGANPPFSSEEEGRQPRSGVRPNRSAERGEPEGRTNMPNTQERRSQTRRERTPLSPFGQSVQALDPMAFLELGMSPQRLSQTLEPLVNRNLLSDLIQQGLIKRTDSGLGIEGSSEDFQHELQRLGVDTENAQQMYDLLQRRPSLLNAAWYTAAMPGESDPQEDFEYRAPARPQPQEMGSFPRPFAPMSQDQRERARQRHAEDQVRGVPRYANEYLRYLLETAHDLAGQEYVPFPGEQVAPLTQSEIKSRRDLYRHIGRRPQNVTERQAREAFQNVASEERPISEEAAPFYHASARQGFEPEEVDHYMSPYTENVIERMRRKMMERFQEGTMEPLTNQFIKAGAYGSGRHRELAYRAARDAEEKMQDLEAQLRHSAYQDALKTALTDRERQMRAGQNIAQSREADIQSQLRGATALHESAGNEEERQMRNLDFLRQMGAEERQQRQAENEAAMQEYRRQMEYPITRLGLMQSTIRGQQLPTVISQSAPPQILPQQSPWGSVGGGLMGIGGMMGQAAQQGRKTGGRVYKQEGGSVTDSLRQNLMQNMYQNMMQAQQQQAQTPNYQQALQQHLGGLQQQYAQTQNYNPMWNFLARTGFGVMGSDRPVLKAAGESASRAFEHSQQEQAQNTQRQMALRGAILDTLKVMQSAPKEEEKELRSQLLNLDQQNRQFGLQERQIDQSGRLKERELGETERYHKAMEQEALNKRLAELDAYREKPLKDYEKDQRAYEEEKLKNVIKEGQEAEEVLKILDQAKKARQKAMPWGSEADVYKRYIQMIPQKYGRPKDTSFFQKNDIRQLEAIEKEARRKSQTGRMADLKRKFISEMKSQGWPMESIEQEWNSRQNSREVA